MTGRSSPSPRAPDAHRLCQTVPDRSPSSVNQQYTHTHTQYTTHSAAS